MRYLDLFSGIGGFALGLYWAGWRFEEHYFSEAEPYCIELYQKRFPDAIFLGDIKDIDCSELPKGEWVITGGFPCQDISIAGRGEGIQAERSGLWFEMWRVIRELRPQWVVAENVGAITFRGLGAVVNSLAKIGYDCEWQDIRASDVGAPHKRERIWIVAYPTSNRWSDRICPVEYRKEGKRRETSFRSSYRKWVEIRQEDKTISGEWIPRSETIGVASRIPRQVDRLKGLGNAIVPQIAELIFRKINETI